MPSALDNSAVVWQSRREPPAANARAIAAADTLSGISVMSTASYWPKAKYEFSTLPPSLSIGPRTASKRSCGLAMSRARLRACNLPDEERTAWQASLRGMRRGMAELCSPEARPSRGRVKKQHGEAKVEVRETFGLCASGDTIFNAGIEYGTISHYGDSA